MARATRSSATTDRLDDAATATQQPATSSTAALKKRKRRSNSPENDAQPAAKHSRTEHSEKQQTPLPSPPSLKDVGEVPLSSEDAAKILDVLEMTDTQGLLDRLFPLPNDPSSSSNPSYSLRFLLQNSPHHPLSLLRSAVNNLFPISSQSRARLSSPAWRQIQFCNLALSLLDEASTRSVQFPLESESIFPAVAESLQDELPATLSSVLQPPRKYALVQHLPQGDYWSSLNSTLPTPSSGDTRELKDLPTGYAELVSIFPYQYPLTRTTPSLGSYHKKVIPSQKQKMPMQRRATKGNFLDYGVWGSFAPTFELEYAEIGRHQLGQVYYGQEMRRKAAEERRNMLLLAAKRMHQEDHAMDEVEEIKESGSVTIDVESELKDILPLEEVENIKAALNSLEMQSSVEELLERNRKALKRLEELQLSRLQKEDGGTSVAEEGSEEWETAQSILDSLTVLASLRPRTSGCEPSTIMPTAKLLHALQRTLPLADPAGWNGTLPAAQAVALRDDSTIKYRAGTTVSVPKTTTPAVPVTATAPANTVTSSTSFSGFNYQYATPQQGQYRAPATAAYTTTYRPGSATPYYPSSQYQQPAQGGQNAYYSAQAYAAIQATGHQPYAYTGWFSSFQPNAGGTTSGRGTPQPVTSAASMPSTYGSFFAATHTGTAAATPPPRTPAVANTVVGAKQAQWAAGYAQQPPMLPLHMRTAQNGGTYQASTATG
ncbi:uncharacterized protein BT62DRAFT_991177 [Guyanagaster necrorhizus]|uniref:Uncharacterized protein n=1 Tax=Guyanagaster necrorhizus TaxID=856835 RepID=A0A9P7W0U7_9AGAR|nr:uncharacterized protein BT62DRAFT_991177 [Guyanagaster necrorhizus MCA 3950]KAG7450117.1 hypothetical protein BT62DRAFT_991177 [Guyanagaster necrorhizus MCA 3950]